MSLPAAVDSEAAICGAVLLWPEVLAQVQGVVEPRDFFAPQNQAVIQAAFDLAVAGAPIDPITVEAELARTGRLEALRCHGGRGYLVTLSEAAITPSTLQFHSGRVREAGAMRRLLEGLDAARLELMQPGAHLAAGLETASRAITQAAMSGACSDPVPIRQAAREAVERIQERHQRRGQLTGVTTGYRAADLATSGWQAAELILGAARPGVGKTAWAASVAQAAACADVPVLFVSLEMDRFQLVERLFASTARVPGMSIRSADLCVPELTRLVRATTDLSPLPLWIDDQADQNIQQIVGKVRRWRLKDAPPDKHPKALVIVDYVQFISSTRGKDSSREQEIAGFSRALKNLARELRIPVLALAQLNREVERRADKRPVLSDLRESGALEQDADVVAFIHRPAIYDKQANGERAELIIAKNRSGAVGMVPMRWQEAFTRYSDEAE